MATSSFGFGTGTGTGTSSTANPYESQLTGLYQQYLGRAPDAAGLQYWEGRMGDGMSFGDITNSFIQSPEFQARLSSLNNPTSSQSGTGNGFNFGSGPYGGGSGSAPYQAATSYGMGSNPFQGAQADAITNASQNFLNNANNSIRSNFVGVGGLGGSRQGVAQGVAQGQAANYLQSNLANLYGNNWNQDQNRALQQYQGDQNFYTAQRGQDMQSQMNGAYLYNMGQQGQWSPYQNWGNILSNYTGFGNSGNTTSSGGGLQGAFGGGLGLLTLLNGMGR